MPALQNVARAFRNAVAPITDDLSEIAPTDVEFTDARDAVAKAQSTREALAKKHHAVLVELDKDEAMLKRLAYSVETGEADLKEHDTLAAKVQKQQADLERLQGAIAVAHEEEREAQQRLHQLGIAGKLKMVRRQGKQYVGIAQEATKKIEELAAILSALQKHSEKMRFSWPMPGNPPAFALGTSEQERMLSDEFWRVLPHNATDLHRTITIPGASSPNGKGDPAKFPPSLIVSRS